MPDTRITRQKIKDHMSYSKKVYIIGAIIAALMSSLLFTVTRYRSPNERAVYIALVDTYTMADNLGDVIPSMLAAGQEFDNTLEEVTFTSIAYSGRDDVSTQEDYYGAQIYTVQLYAADNDAYVQCLRLTEDMIMQDYCVALETLPGYDAFVQRFPNAEFLWREQITPELYKKISNGEEIVADDYAEPLPTHAYAISVDSLTGFIERSAYDNREKYVCIVSTSTNIDTTFEVLTEMFARLAPSAEAAQ